MQQEQVRSIVYALQQNIRRVIVGKNEAIELALIALLCKGHVLIEDVPGVPSDITGFTMPSLTTGQMEFKPGAVMSQIVLADEINRTSPRTQSSLLEVMEEGQVTVDGVTHPLPRPFMVLATQNPVYFVGTYPLPEAQMDRFFLRIAIGYPTIEEEMDVLERYSSPSNPLATLQSICSANDVIAMQEQVGTVYCSPEVRSYVAQIAAATRSHPQLTLGISPRGGIALIRAAQACALMNNRDYVLPDDVKRIALPVCTHRLVLSPEARMKGQSADRLLASILSAVPVPGNYT